MKRIGEAIETEESEHLSKLPPTLRHSMRHLTRVLHSEFRAALMAQSLSLSEYEAMVAVRDVPGLSSAELARWAAVSPQSANQVLRQLERRAVVVRTPAPGDGRIIENRLTGKGARLIELCERAGAEIEQRMTAGMSDAERDALERLLGRIARSLGSPIGEEGIGSRGAPIRERSDD